ncbi:MAG: ATP synthase F1 subunit gamma [Rubrivivax sp.]|nr:ATP synthase F1 subunit gamma [Rubrivivax sp.]
MATLRDIRRRIKSVKKTSQITKAMQMVAAARLRRMQEFLTNAKPYAEKMEDVVVSLSTRVDKSLYPLFEQRDAPRKLQLVVVSTDRGLCGGLNTNLFRRVESFLKENKDKYQEISLYLIGRKARDYLRRRYQNIKVAKSYLLSGKADFSVAVPIAKEFIASFISGETDEIGIFYNHFYSILTQRPTYKSLLPIASEAALGEEIPDHVGECIYEPSRDELLKTLLPRYLEVLIFRVFLEAQTSEFAARMRAMDSATSNAKEMIDRLTLTYNRARQAAITKELMDIVNGAEALRYQG